MPFEDIDDPYRKRVLRGMGPGLTPPGPGNLPSGPVDSSGPGRGNLPSDVGGGINPPGPGNLPPPVPRPLPRVDPPIVPRPLPRVDPPIVPRPLPRVPAPGLQQPPGPDPRSIPGSNLVAGRPTFTAGSMLTDGTIPTSEPPIAPITSPDDLARSEPPQAPAPAPAAPGRYDLEAIRKKWYYNDGDINDPQGWLQRNQDIAAGVTIRGDKMYDPSGRFIADVIGNYKDADKTNDSRIFLDGIGANNKPRIGPKPLPKVTGPISPGGPGNLPPGAPGVPGPGTAPAANNFLTQIRQQIMERLGRMSQDPSMNDPALAAQSAAYRRARERGAGQQRAAEAERAAAQGLLLGGQSSGSFDTAMGGINEAAAEDVAGNDASLMGQEVAARRSEVQQLLNMALQSGDAESARVLQSQLAALDAQLRREALKENARQYNLSDKYRYKALDQNKGQWDDQYGRQLGRDYEDDYWRRVLYGFGQ